MYLAIFEDGHFATYALETEVPDDDAVSLVIPLDDREISLVEFVERAGSDEMTHALCNLISKGFSRGFSHGRRKCGE